MFGGHILGWSPLGGAGSGDVQQPPSGDVVAANVVPGPPLQVVITAGSQPAGAAISSPNPGRLMMTGG